MDSRVTIFLAAIALSCGALSATAQVPGSDDDLFAPPDTKYVNGSREADPAIQASLPVAERYRAFLPKAVDLSTRMPAVGDQGGLGSCTAWSTAYAARSYYSAAIERRDVSAPANIPSPNYVFHVARGASKCDDGTSFPQVVDVLKHGALSLAEYPYSDACVAPPSRQFVARAHDFRVRGLRRIEISRTDDVKGQLARGNPVLIRFKDSSAFHRLRGDKIFDGAMPPSGDKTSGYHAMALVGYDERRQAFRLINSWTSSWGDHGFAWVSYDLLGKRIVEADVLDVGPLKPVPVPVHLPPPPPAPPKVNPTPQPPTPVVKSPPPAPPVVIAKLPPQPSPAPVKVQPGPVLRPGIALVIGNSAYPGAPLATTVADAGLVAETMRAAGYKVIELKDVHEADIGIVLRNFLDQVVAAGPGSVAFFYYAGFAAQFGAKNYLVPVDAKIDGSKDVAAQALRLDDLVEELAKLPAVARFIVLDAARDHGYGRGTPDLVPPGLANLAAPPGMMVAFSAMPGSIAEELSGSHSLYTAALVGFMREPGLDIERIFDGTRFQVNHASEGRQTPWTADSLTSDVTLFAGPPPQPKPVAPPPAPPEPDVPVSKLDLSDLGKLACGHVVAQTREGQSVLSGYVASDEDLKRVKSIAANVKNTSLGDITVAPWPQCEALQTLEKPLAMENRPVIDIGPASGFRSGDVLGIHISAPSQISYLYIAYIQADGTVVNLAQPKGVVAQPTLPSATLVFGDGLEGRDKFTISPPFGPEMIIAIASRSPLFDGELPVQQTEREYLSALRRALLYKPSPDMPDRELSATIKTLKTRAR